MYVPSLRDDDVVDGLVALAEAREADLDDHRELCRQRCKIGLDAVGATKKM